MIGLIGATIVVCGADVVDVVVGGGGVVGGAGVVVVVVVVVAATPAGIIGMIGTGIGCGCLWNCLLCPGRRRNIGLRLRSRRFPEPSEGACLSDTDVIDIESELLLPE